MSGRNPERRVISMRGFREEVFASEAQTFPRLFPQRAAPRCDAGRDRCRGRSDPRGLHWDRASADPPGEWYNRRVFASIVADILVVTVTLAIPVVKLLGQGSRRLRDARKKAGG